MDFESITQSGSNFEDFGKFNYKGGDLNVGCLLREGSSIKNHYLWSTTTTTTRASAISIDRC